MSLSNLFHRRKSSRSICRSINKHINLLQLIQSQHPLLFQQLINSRFDSRHNNHNLPSHHTVSDTTSSTTSPIASTFNNPDSTSPSPSPKHSISTDNVKVQLDKSLGKVSKYLHDMRVILLGDPESDGVVNSSSMKREEEQRVQLMDELFTCHRNAEAVQHDNDEHHDDVDLLSRLIELALSHTLDFESRKECSNIVIYLFHHHPQAAINFMTHHTSLRHFLQQHYLSSSSSSSSCQPASYYPDIVLECGEVLREAALHKPIAQLMIDTDHFLDQLFHMLQLHQFDILSDAWETFRLLLTEHKDVAAQYLSRTFDEFVCKFSQLLQSDNFAAKRQSLKLLRELLLSRTNFEFMMKFISSTQCLRSIMMLCRTDSLSVQLEAFAVLKLFIANPRKTDSVSLILSLNKQVLTDFLLKIAQEIVSLTPKEEKEQVVEGDEKIDKERAEKMNEKQRIPHEEAFILIADLDKLPPPMQFTGMNANLISEDKNSSPPFHDSETRVNLSNSSQPSTSTSASSSCSSSSLPGATVSS